MWVSKRSAWCLSKKEIEKNALAPLVRCWILFRYYFDSNKKKKLHSLCPFWLPPPITYLLLLTLLTFLEKRKSCSPIIDFEVHFTLIFKLVTAYLSTFPLAISLDQMVQTIR